MALTGIQIYKLLPQTNCKECSFPTCLAFAMKLAAKQVELSACPYVTEESKKQLAESAAPPIRLITLKADGMEVKAGNEVCLFRHEKTFYNKPGLFLRLKASDPDIAKKVAAADAYMVNYVGMDFTLDGFAIEADGDLAAAVKAVRGVTKRPLILIGNDAAALDSALGLLPDEGTLIYAADSSNYEALAEVAKKHKVSEQTIYTWRKRFGTLEPADVKRLRQLETENAKLKRIVAERDLEIDTMKEINRRKW